MKSIIASGLLLGMAHGAAIAGPYVNVENNAGFTGSDFTSQTTDFHVGYESEGPFGSWGIQGGPSLVVPDGGEQDTVLTGKIFPPSPLPKSCPSMVSCRLRSMTPTPMAPRLV